MPLSVLLTGNNIITLRSEVFTWLKRASEGDVAAQISITEFREDAVSLAGYVDGFPVDVRYELAAEDDPTVFEAFAGVIRTYPELMAAGVSTPERYANC